MFDPDTIPAPSLLWGQGLEGSDLLSEPQTTPRPTSPPQCSMGQRDEDIVTGIALGTWQTPRGEKPPPSWGVLGAPQIQTLGCSKPCQTSHCVVALC